MMAGSGRTPAAEKTGQYLSKHTIDIFCFFNKDTAQSRSIVTTSLSRLPWNINSEEHIKEKEEVIL